MKSSPKKAKKTVSAKASHCEIVVVLDRSGSMSSIQRDMQGGFNTFVKEQQALEGTCNLTLVQFDTGGVETVYEGMPIASVPALTFIPRGGTPLYDAIGKTLAGTQARITDKNTKVVFVIITDGQENSSIEWTSEKIKVEVEARTKDGWLFQFLGANIDSFSEGSTLGFSALSTMDYGANAKGVNAMYAASSGSVMRFRSSTATGQELLRESAFTEEEIKKAKE